MRSLLLVSLVFAAHVHGQVTDAGDTELKIDDIPFPLNWDDKPETFEYKDGKLRIEAGARTDLFRDPGGGAAVTNSPRLLFKPGTPFLFSARVSADFESDFDAGLLVVYEGEDAWAKLCFELSPQKQPMVVTVVNKGISDDSNHIPIVGDHVYLRIAGLGDGTVAFHFSLEGKTWHLARYFALTPGRPLQVGFSAQSPTGKGCTASFSEIRYEARLLKDVRSGE